MAEGQTEIARLLLEKGAKTDVVDRWGTTPLLEALSINALAVAEMLIARGSKLGSNNFAVVKDASETDSGQLSLVCTKANGSPDSCDYDKRSVLHAQCLAGNLKAVEALLGVGANVNVTDRCGLTVLFLRLSSDRCFLIETPSAEKSPRYLETVAAAEHSTTRAFMCRWNGTPIQVCVAEEVVFIAQSMSL